MDRQRTYRNGSRQRRGARRQPGRMWFLQDRRQLPAFFFRIGPITLSICSVLLISLMAILYLSQQGQAVTTNQQIQELRNQQTAAGQLSRTSPVAVASFRRSSIGPCWDPRGSKSARRLDDKCPHTDKSPCKPRHEES